MTSDGKPYGPIRYKNILTECWYVSDNLNTSYTDVLDLAVSDRLALINLIKEKIENTNKALEDAKNKSKN
jgi:hypothetical protein